MELKLNFILAFCIIFCMQCNILSVKAIIGHNLRFAEPNEVPYIVAFIRNIPGQTNIYDNFKCAGTIVTRRHVLSTAVCTTDANLSQTLILAGTNDLTNGFLYQILWSINFAEWNNYRHRRTLIGINDISVTKIEDTFHESIPAAMISPMMSAHLRNREVLISGWGRTNDGQYSLSLLATSVRVLSTSECEDIITRLDDRRMTVDIRFICTVANPFVLLHDGDFGGPVISGDYVIGINKETRPFPNNVFHPEKVNIHMNLDFYRPFITATTDDNFDWINHF